MLQDDYESVLNLLAPGRSYYVPKSVDRSHPLWGRLDGRTHGVLCSEMGGTTLYVPVGGSLDRRRRALVLSVQGRSVKEIAAHLGVTVRTVQRYLA